MWGKQGFSGQSEYGEGERSERGGDQSPLKKKVERGRKLQMCAPINQKMSKWELDEKGPEEDGVEKKVSLTGGGGGGIGEEMGKQRQTRRHLKKKKKKWRS